MKKFGKIVGGIVVLIALVVGCVFVFSAGAGEAADNVLAELNAGKVNEVYQNSSKEFKENVNLEDFTIFVTGNNLKSADFTKTKSHKWTGRGFNNAVKYVYGEVLFADDKNEIVNVQFIKNDGELKLYGLAFGAVE